MGLLALGTPLDWPATKPLAEHIRRHGITQFLHTWNRWKDSPGKGLLWGDEVSEISPTGELARPPGRWRGMGARSPKDAVLRWGWACYGP